ncbi:MAG: hypothetical protein ABGZ53_20590 [Fuerstiella sp.]
MSSKHQVMRTTLLLAGLCTAFDAATDEDPRGEIPPELIERVKVVMK